MIIQVNGVVDNPYIFIGFQVLAGCLLLLA